MGSACSTCGCAPWARTTRSSSSCAIPADPTRDVAYVGGIDLCHSRNDDDPPPRRPAAPGDGAGLRLQRPPGTTSSSRSAARPSVMPRRCSGNAGRTRSPLSKNPVHLVGDTVAARGPDGPTAAAAAARPAARAGPRPSSCFAPTRPTRRLPVRAGRGVQRLVRLPEGDRERPLARSTSRTSTCGPPTSRGSSPKRSRGSRSCG